MILFLMVLALVSKESVKANDDAVRWNISTPDSVKENTGDSLKKISDIAVLRYFYMFS